MKRRIFVFFLLMAMEIVKAVVVGDFTYIADSDFEKHVSHLYEWKGDTIIGNDVWLGQNAVILPGVHIGNGAIIGANAVVGSDVEAYSVVVGNPARVIRKRFDGELIGLLEKFKWWDKPVEEIDSLIPILTSGNLEMVRIELKKRLGM